MVGHCPRNSHQTKCISLLKIFTEVLVNVKCADVTKGRIS